MRGIIINIRIFVLLKSNTIQMNTWLSIGIVTFGAWASNNRVIWYYCRGMEWVIGSWWLNDMLIFFFLILNRLYIHPRVNWHRCAKPMVSLGIWSTNGEGFPHVSFLEDSTCISSICLGWIGWNCQRVKVGGPDFLFSGLQKEKTILAMECCDKSTAWTVPSELTGSHHFVMSQPPVLGETCQVGAWTV